MSKNAFFLKEATCPICLTEFLATTVRPNRCIPQGKEADFHYKYSGVIPYLYDIWVCPECHYAAPKSIFNTVKHDEITKIAEILSKTKLPIDPLGERTHQQAITYFKLALLFMSYRKVPTSLIAGVCLKTAWIYRDLEDTTNEQEYIHKAIQFYEEAYSTERFPIGNLSEVRVAYLLGELHRRVGEYGEAVRWFDKAVNNPKSFAEPAIVKMARDQWSYAKEQYNEQKKMEISGDGVVNA